MARPLVLVGAGEFALIAREYFTHDAGREVVAFAVERAWLDGETVDGLPVIAYEDIESIYPQDEVDIFVAIPASGLNRLRTRFYLDLKRRGYRFARYISSRAFVWRNAQVGEHCFIFENNVIQPFTTIGDNCILWSGNHIGHRAILHDNVFMASHAVVSGYCEIGTNSFVGVNATFNDRVRVAADNVIGAGALVVRDTEPGLVYVGSPAKALPGKSSLDVAL
ncbi:acetyltransferase [Bacillus sp. NP157]|nr:acetyltransferase [Bacillus sp. NP157]